MFGEVWVETTYPFPFRRWSWAMDTEFHSTLYYWCNYFSMLRLKLIHIGKMWPYRSTGHDSMAISNRARSPSYWSQPNTRMLVTLCICLKQYFDTRYLVFYNTSPPRMFLSLDLLWEYRIQHGANAPLYVTSSYSTWIFCRGVSGFATDCPCDVWCRGLTTCLLHVGPPFGNRILNNSWAVGLT